MDGAGGVQRGHIAWICDPALVITAAQFSALLLDIFPVGFEHTPQPLLGRIAVMSLQRLGHVGFQRGEAFGEQGLLGWEMVVERARGDSRGFADIPDGNVVEVLLPHEVQSGLQNSLLGFPGLVPAALGVIHEDTPFRNIVMIIGGTI
ncbi:hypothetical protein SDC9_138293 [bioreactor metagenome]|uniref:Uncharacterized protein n=1 Tax=bioreactor metagenome TaxID=1076179 RepID=A0A645DPD9_9ZZZZ